jgi:hypothetical protein
MSGMLRKCCVPVCCSGDEWTCDEDLVEFDITLHHKINATRSTILQIEMCCSEIGGCSPRDGWDIQHDVPLDMEIEYECRFKVYMTPPSGAYTSLYDLGTWTQSNLCDPVWETNPTLGGTGPKIVGTWDCETHRTGAFPCGSGNCYSNSGPFPYSRKNELLVNMAFNYETVNPTVNIPPSDILSMIKLRNLPDSHGGTQDCCTGIKTPGCDDRCLIDLQINPGNVSMSMDNPDGVGYSFHEIVTRLAGTAPNCTLGVVDVNQTYPAPTDQIVFATGARMAYEGSSVTTCDPVLQGTAVAAVDSELATTWNNVKTVTGSAFPSFYDAATGFLWDMSLVNSGFQITSLNSGQINVGSTSFYTPGQGTGGDPCVVCVPGDTEHNVCDGLNGGTSEFYIPPLNAGGICPKYKFNLVNGWTDHIWEFAYMADFACGATGRSCLPCTLGTNAVYNSGTANDETGVKLKTTVTINSATPVDSANC